MDQRTHAWKQHRLGERAAGWLAGAREPVAWLDAGSRLVYANPAFETLTGLTLRGAAGQTLAALQPFGRATANVVALLAQARDSRTLAAVEFCWPLPDGTESALYVGVRADIDAADAVLGYLIGGRDVTPQRQVERSLRERETEFRTLADNSPDNIIRYGLDGRAVYCNREIEGRVNVAVSSVLGRTALEGAPPGLIGAEEYERQVMRALHSGEDGQVELSVLDPSGERHTHSVLIRAERDDDGRICGALAIGRDVSDIARARQALADKEREFRTLADNAGDNIARWSTDGRLLYVNPAMAAQLALAPADAIGLDADAVGGGRFPQVADAVRRVVAEDRPLLEDLRFNDPRDERERVHQIRLVPEHDDSGAVVSVLGIGRDVTEVVRQREAFEHLARTDALTGAANRQQLYERAPGLLEAARRSGRRLGVMLLDLDGFKTVNDSLGHRAGDELLRAVAAQLQTCIRASDLLVRLGGDEFVLIVADVDAPAAVGAVAQKVRHALQQAALAGGGRAARVDASIGVVTFPDDGADMDTLLAHADLAMYQAKRNGRGRVEYFRAELSAAMHRRAALEQALNDADPAHGLALYMQPVFALGPEPRIVGAEALLRWNHPVLGPLTPDEFIPVAEECGQIVPLGRWVLRQAAEAAVRWNRGRQRPLRVAVNVSTRQFALDDVAAAVRETLAQTGCEARWLLVEITESLLLVDCGEVQRTLEALRALGVAVAIDDFGTGYSALHYLARFNVDCLKIDKGFVQGIGEADRRGELVKAFVAMARALELDVVAEGIETPAQLAFLDRLGCGFGQGYLLARPMPMAAFEASLPAPPVLTA